MSKETEHSAKPSVESKPKPSTPCTETILVVDDEEDLRDLVVQVLESRGYTIFAASCGKEALEKWAQKKDHIDLLLTDMLMPDGMTGYDLAEVLKKDAPNLRVLYTSGHAAGIPGTHLEAVDECNFLAKPYRPSQLIQTVRDCLDQAAPKGA